MEVLAPLAVTFGAAAYRETGSRSATVLDVDFSHRARCFAHCFTY